ncbi:hypothetical protein WAB17_10825 [Parerythrobacter aurantius]|uniref:hypothetical protein n=1 Tax=Parerythrobacter aurantius TaxID=3127706 RepID=UPI003249C7A1
MVTKRRFIMVWVGGLVAFAVTVWLHLPLVLETVPGGILDHQRAGTAERVDVIQREWAAAGVYRSALTAMLSDVGFILLYGTGSLLGGLYFMRRSRPLVRRLGAVLALSAGLFIAADLLETGLQLSQLVAAKGDDVSAGLAAAMAYPKLVGWTLCFLLPLVGLVLDGKAAVSR